MYNISLIGIVTLNPLPYNEYILIKYFIIIKKKDGSKLCVKAQTQTHSHFLFEPVTNLKVLHGFLFLLLWCNSIANQEGFRWKRILSYSYFSVEELCSSWPRSWKKSGICQRKSHSEVYPICIDWFSAYFQEFLSKYSQQEIA
jgi:hypothetical protein